MKWSRHSEWCSGVRRYLRFARTTVQKYPSSHTPSSSKNENDIGCGKLDRGVRVVLTMPWMIGRLLIRSMWMLNDSTKVWTGRWKVIIVVAIIFHVVYASPRHRHKRLNRLIDSIITFFLLFAPFLFPASHSYLSPSPKWIKKKKIFRSFAFLRVFVGWTKVHVATIVVGAAIRQKIIPSISFRIIVIVIVVRTYSELVISHCCVRTTWRMVKRKEKLKSTTTMSAQRNEWSSRNEQQKQQSNILTKLY